MTLAEPSQTESAQPEDTPSSAAQTNLPPGLTERRMHDPELEGEDGQGGMMREAAAELRVVITGEKKHDVSGTVEEQERCWDV